MAKKKSKKEIAMDDMELDENGEPAQKGSKMTSILIALVIIAIWMVIFGLLIKMDVGGVGSMLRPYLKNIPVVNQVLPAASDAEVASENGYQYKNMTEAIARIKDLESQLSNYQNTDSSSAQTISDLQAEVARLKTFEDNQANFQQMKDEFDKEVVYTDNAPDISNYKSWYEKIDPANAATLYKQVCEEIQFSQEVQDWASTYSKMDAKNAAAIMQEMTGDTNLVSKALLCMTAKQRAAILADMDTIYAAKLTKIMYPSK